MYDDVLSGFSTAFSTVIPSIPVILNYEPTSIQNFPTMYSLLERVDRSSVAQRTIMRYRISHTLVFRWQDNERAETEIVPFVNAVPAAVDAAQSSGMIVGNEGSAEISEISAMWVSIGGIVYRAIVFYSSVLEKGARLSGI